MAVENPCPCIPLNTAVKIVAIVNMIFDAIAVIIYIISISVIASVLGYEYQHKTSSTILAIALVFAIILVFCGIGHFILGILLYLGADKREYGKCRLWFIVTCILLVLFFINNVIGGVTSSFIMVILVILIQLYQLWVVFAFMEEVKSGPIVVPFRNDEDAMKHDQDANMHSNDATELEDDKKEEPAINFV